MKGGDLTLCTCSGLDVECAILVYNSFADTKFAVNDLFYRICSIVYNSIGTSSVLHKKNYKISSLQKMGTMCICTDKSCFFKLRLFLPTHITL